MTQCSAFVYSLKIRSHLSPTVCTVCLDYRKQNTLSSWQNSWPVCYLIGRWHVPQNLNIISYILCATFYSFFKTRNNTMGWLRAFLYSLYRIFSPCAIRGPSLTGFVYFRIPSSQLGLEWTKKTVVLPNLHLSRRIVDMCVRLKTPMTGK
jgi:hypothetical protein